MEDELTIVVLSRSSFHGPKRKIEDIAEVEEDNA